MKLKVCGITTIEQLQQLAALDIDFAGLIFYEKSKRYAYEKLHDQKSLIKAVDIKKVGVFVNADMGFLKSCITDFGLHAVQLHGDETTDYCRQLMEETIVIKVFRISEATTDMDKVTAPYLNACQYFLFDTDTTGYGGSGNRFDWNIFKNAVIGKPFFLSGGIDPDDLEHLKNFSHPFFYAIDVNSRFEISPGIKNMHIIKSFVNRLKPALWTK